MSSPTDLSLRARHAPRPGVWQQARAVTQDFLAFVKRPTRGHPRRRGFRAGLGAVATLLVLNLLFNLLASGPVSLVLEKTIGLANRHDPTSGAFLFSALALAPLMEELMLRAGLRSARWTVFGMPVLAAMFVASTNVMLGMAFGAGAFWLFDTVTRKRLPAQAQAAMRWRRGRAFIGNYRFLIWGYALVFASLHLSNFVHDGGIGWKSALVVLAVISQFMGALVLSYLRLRHGLFSAIAAHFCWNAFAVGMHVLAS